MAAFNKIILVGNLTRDPELRYLPSGAAVAKLGLAVNNSYKNKDGNTVDDTLFIDIDVFGRQAETVHQYMKKGSSVLVEGRLRYRTWTGNDEVKHYKHDVAAQRVVFMGSAAAVSNKNIKSANENRDNSPEEEDDIPF